MKFDLKLLGYVGGEDFNADIVRRTLDKKKDSEVHVLINSTGGSAGEALTIASEFRNHGNVIVHLQGLNASAATIASMGAKKILMEEASMYLIHKCSMPFLEWATKNADQIDKTIEELQAIKADLNTLDLTVAKMYAKKCKKPHAQMLDIMRIGAWLDSQTTLDLGLVDEIETDQEAAKPVLTASTVTSFLAAAIPLPPICITDQTKLECIATAIGLKNENQKPKPIIMKKFVTLAALLAVEAFNLVEGCVTLDESQMQKIEDAMAELKANAVKHANEISARDKEISERDETIKTLEARIKDLESQPADEPKQVIDKGGSTSAMESDLAQEAKMRKEVEEMRNFLRS